MSGCLVADIMSYCCCCCLDRIFGSGGLHCETRVLKKLYLNTILDSHPTLIGRCGLGRVVRREREEEGGAGKRRDQGGNFVRTFSPGKKMFPIDVAVRMWKKSRKLIIFNSYIFYLVRTWKRDQGDNFQWFMVLFLNNSYNLLNFVEIGDLVVLLLWDFVSYLKWKSKCSLVFQTILQNFLTHFTVVWILTFPLHPSCLLLIIHVMSLSLFLFSSECC